MAEPLAVLPMTFMNYELKGRALSHPCHMRRMRRMFDIQREKLNWCGRELVLETGRIARQADGAVLATGARPPCWPPSSPPSRPSRPGLLPAHRRLPARRPIAAGRIPGGFLKREGQLSEKETLVSRLIDRPIRPLFPDGFRCETQVIVTVLSHDMETDPDILAMVASSAALTPVRRALHGPDRRRPRRLYQGRDRRQPDASSR